MSGEILKVDYSKKGIFSQENINWYKRINNCGKFKSTFNLNKIGTINFSVEKLMGYWKIIFICRKKIKPSRKTHEERDNLSLLSLLQVDS